MATYFHGAQEIQPDGLQTLYLMNPSYVGYTDAAAPANMVLLNSTINSVSPINLGGQLNHHHQQQQQQQHFVGIPLQPAAAAQAHPHESTRPPTIHDVSAIQGLVPRLHYNLWTPSQSSTSPVDMASQFGPRRPSAVPPSAQQGLSLSLSPHEMMAPATDMTPASTDEVKIVASSASLPPPAANGASGLQSFLMGSKYLKAAQQLLDEVVNVGKGIKNEPAKRASSKNPADSGNMESKGTGSGAAEENTSSKRGADLTTAERQELQMKKAKLINMLEEVEQRYRQYHHQMQIVVSSFEAVAGYGSARTYTALALRTISKQFRCLRDAITCQIRATSKSLGEEDSSKSGGSRLRFIDHHLRQQRALQQLGMIQQNAWRPQRGLPERSVSILRAWLFEHFLHPYPKDSDKLMLAKQTGLTRSQVSNWFINARVRLWKPMVEEMYMEEIKDPEQNHSEENTSKSDANGSSTSKSNAQQESSPTATGPADSLNLKSDPKQTLAAVVQPSSYVHSQSHSYYDKDAMAAQSAIKRARSNDSPLQVVNSMANSITVAMKPDEATSNQEMLMKFMEGRPRVEEQGYHHPLIAASTASHGGNYGTYAIGELGRFDAEQFAPRFSAGNGVSLTLGLQHSENLSLSGGQPSFLSGERIQLGRRLEMGTEAGDYCSLNNTTAVAHPSNAATFRTDRGLLLNYYQTS